MGTYEIIDFSKYKGWHAYVRGYITEHKMLVLGLQHERCVSKPEFILCDYCWQFPTKTEWIVEDLRMYQFEEFKCLLTDWKQGMFVVCRGVWQREGFNLGRWIGGGEELPTEEKMRQEPF